MILIRTDSNSSIASGHVARCLRIAETLSKKGNKPVFLVSDNNSRPLIESSGFKCIVLNTDWRKLAGEAGIIASITNNEKAILLVDTYSISAEYVKELSGVADIVYLGSKKDNLGNPKAIINYQLGIDRTSYANLKNRANIYLGGEYAPIRGAYSEQYFLRTSPLVNVLVTTGGSNKNGCMEKILDKITSADFKSLQFHIIVGAFFDNSPSIAKLYNHDNFHFYENLSDLLPVFKKCDLAITACGTTTYEMAAQGLPMISFAMTDEQTRDEQSMSRLGVIYGCGSFALEPEACIDRIATGLTKAVTHFDSFISLSQRAKKISDGLGCERIADILIKMEES